MRADAERNRDKILEAARDAFAESGDPASMAEIARRAGVGMATLYRNFPGRRQELLEALYQEEVEAMCAPSSKDQPTPAGALDDWLLRFADFFARKHTIATELLAQPKGNQNPIFDGSRDRVLFHGRPLLEAAQESGEIRADLTLEQVLDLVIAVSAIRGEAGYREPIFQAALDGIRAPRA